jgi:hypothetical protein
VPNAALGRLHVITHFRKILLPSLVLVGLAIAGAGVASAQDVYKVNYFDFNSRTLAGFPVPDATVRIDNPGLTYGNLCSMIYVYAADQQLSECCGCINTPNGLLRLSVRSQLTSNPLIGAVPFSGVIKVVSALPVGGITGTACDPTSVTPRANLRVWATHIQPGTAFGSFGGLIWPVTETESSDSTLGATELAALQQQCMFIHILGSGHGVCSCGAVVE